MFRAYIRAVLSLYETIYFFSHTNSNEFKSNSNKRLFEGKDFATTHIKFTVTPKKVAYGERYSINMISSIKYYKASMLLCESKKSNGSNSERVEALIKYLESNRPAWGE